VSSFADLNAQLAAQLVTVQKSSVELSTTNVTAAHTTSTSAVSADAAATLNNAKVAS